ncbi:MAG: cytochrome c nitrite reductase small subunit [Bryobacteraceae bacterium]|nr:cytochrome c nitrite reductase small subunit [Bryobacteraceae bacterium]
MTRDGQSTMGAGGYLLVLVGVLIGAALGLGLFTFGYARGASYLTDNPEACANCHVMREQHESWMKGSHRAVAVCNDCHTPAGFAPKYATKVRNGFFHSLAFTTGWFPDVIRITGFSREVAEASCDKCHSQIVAGIQNVRAHNEPVACIQCHSRVGHQ